MTLRTDIEKILNKYWDNPFSVKGVEPCIDEIMLLLEPRVEKVGEVTVEKIIGEHNARILNEFQLMGLGDERILWAPIEKATKETLGTPKADKLKAGAKDFNDRFTGVMQELADEEKPMTKEEILERITHKKASDYWREVDPEKLAEFLADRLKD